MEEVSLGLTGMAWNEESQFWLTGFAVIRGSRFGRTGMKEVGLG
jgi:hypothetical protein